MILPTQYQHFQFISHYSRFLEEEGRRETWTETVDRYCNFMFKGAGFSPALEDDLRASILNLDVMPSMRALWTAGPALELDNAAGYNCSFVRIDQPYKFAEVLYNLMCGCGVGFSVERQFVCNLPEIPDEFYHSATTVVVEDSKLGWAHGLREVISMLYNGQEPKWDLSKVRAAGARLHTFGGRASGPAPLEELFRFCVRIFRSAAGRRLTSLECHDIVCKTGDAVVSGGVRRSALISLSNLSDDRMRNAKVGDWWRDYPWRQLANNSAVYTERPTMDVFLQEWTSLFLSKSGERGIYNVQAAQAQAGRNGRRNAEHHFGTNPCSEIILRDRQFCNLSEVVIRADDTFETLVRKVRHATILGTLQSRLTNFRFLSKTWKENCEEERLLGVSLTGIMDNRYTSFALPYVPMHWTNSQHWEAGADNSVESMLRSLRAVAVKTNVMFAAKLGINFSTAITCVKPSGTVSQLVNSSSGIHPRYARNYIRRTRLPAYDPVVQLLLDAHFPIERSLSDPNNTAIIPFPIQGPSGCLERQDVSALRQLAVWSKYQSHWCEHKPSCSVYIRDSEWLEVGAWVYKHFDIMTGVAFFPYDENATIYTQPPYEVVSEEAFARAVASTPMVDWLRLSNYEKTDSTSGSREFACVSGACEL